MRIVIEFRRVVLGEVVLTLVCKDGCGMRDRILGLDS